MLYDELRVGDVVYSKLNGLGTAYDKTTDSTASLMTFVIHIEFKDNSSLSYDRNGFSYKRKDRIYSESQIKEALINTFPEDFI